MGLTPGGMTAGMTPANQTAIAAARISDSNFYENLSITMNDLTMT